MRNRALVLAAVLLLIAIVAWAGTDGHGRDIDDILSDIRASLGLTGDDRIDPEQVPEELLIELGDAVMGSHVGDSEQHEWMDEMMGGEGSESLESAHRWMAYRYLTGGYGTVGRFGMMGGGMMGGMMMNGWGLMGDPDMMSGGIPFNSPTEILKQRYASGDISREEYQQMLSDIE